VTTRLPNLDAILKRHKIHPKFWPEFHGMVDDGRLASKELWTRMNYVANFRAARSEIAAELSKGLGHEFPPDDYEVPADYDFSMPAEYESLTPEDVALATSAGAPSAAR
jgi:hypothetical protein